MLICACIVGYFGFCWCGDFVSFWLLWVLMLVGLCVVLGLFCVVGGYYLLLLAADLVRSWYLFVYSWVGCIGGLLVSAVLLFWLIVLVRFTSLLDLVVLFCCCLVFRLVFVLLVC